MKHHARPATHISLCFAFSSLECVRQVDCRAGSRVGDLEERQLGLRARPCEMESPTNNGRWKMVGCCISPTLAGDELPRRLQLASGASIGFSHSKSLSDPGQALAYCSAHFPEFKKRTPISYVRSVISLSSHALVPCDICSHSCSRGRNVTVL
jgi:hypothetical protein